MAASKALPPASRTSMPAEVASGWALAMAAFGGPAETVAETTSRVQKKARRRAGANHVLVVGMAGLPAALQAALSFFSVSRRNFSASCSGDSSQAGSFGM